MPERTDPPGEPKNPQVRGDDRRLFTPERRALVIGLVLTVTLVAFEALAIATVMPDVKDDLGGLGLYGWVFSGFFLASLTGIVVAGQLADRRGLAGPYALGLLVFAAGLLIGAEARSMPMLILGRVCQGLGAGAIPSVAYTAIGRGLPGALRPRMFAALSTAWVVPGLAGPAIATVVEHAASWRWVFGGLIPLVLVAGLLTFPALRDLDRRRPITSAGDFDWQRLARVLLLVVGVGAALTAADLPLVIGVIVGVLGFAVAVWAFVALQPVGTLRLAHGVPATVAVRGLLTWAFFSADAYIALAVKDGRGSGTWVAGTALTAGVLGWTAGSWAQERLVLRLGPRRVVGTGAAIYFSGVAGVLIAMQGLPVAVLIVIWGCGALGMGMSYSPLAVTVLGEADPSEVGAASAALQLSDTLGIAIGTGLGGAIIAVGDSRDWSVASSTSGVFAMSVVMAAIVHLASRRLPRAVPA